MSTLEAYPLVSIVTPSYNQGRFIRETIESVLTQDYSHIEYWVIDGGSIDETLSILKEYEHDPRFHWLSERDNGQSDAINKGLAQCTGEIFNWLNSDDTLLPHALKQVVSVWVELDHPAIIYGMARSIDENSRDLGVCPGQSPRITLQRLIRGGVSPAQQATFLPAEYVRRAGGVDTSFHYTMDLDLWVKIAEEIPIIHIPFELANFRFHYTSKTISLFAKWIPDYQKVLDRAVQRGLISAKQARVRANLFAARVYLTPEIKDLPSAVKCLGGALYDDFSTFSEVVFVFSKALIRLLVGEKNWFNIVSTLTRFK